MNCKCNIISPINRFSICLFHGQYAYRGAYDLLVVVYALTELKLYGGMLINTKKKKNG